MLCVAKRDRCIFNRWRIKCNVDILIILVPMLRLFPCQQL